MIYNFSDVVAYKHPLPISVAQTFIWFSSARNSIGTNLHSKNTIECTLSTGNLVKCPLSTHLNLCLPSFVVLNIK